MNVDNQQRINLQMNYFKIQCEAMDMMNWASAANTLQTYGVTEVCKWRDDAMRAGLAELAGLMGMVLARADEVAK